MPTTEDLEKTLADIRRGRDEAEAQASKAAENLVREASLSKPLNEADPRLVRAAADDFAAAVERLRLLEDFAARLRQLLF